MTAEEAIAIINGAQVVVTNRDPDKFVAAIDRALISLHFDRYMYRKPLTIEELKKLEGEPVWMEWTDGRIQSRWWLVGSHEWNVMEFDDPIMEKNYGKTWVAYCHKPKEG